MKSTDFVEKIKEIALSRKTLYVAGCFGAPMTAANKTRYTKNASYNAASSRSAVIKAAGTDTYGFDDAGLIKGVLWGWTGDKKLTYGGAVYASNKVPDLDADALFAKCKAISDDWSFLLPGELVWMSGHVGVYIGEGKVAESTPSWDGGVQITKLGFVTEFKTRQWTKHGKLPYVKYVEKITLKPLDEIAAEVVEGLWGTGAYRKMRLTTAGYNYDEVQTRVDEIIRANEGTLWTPEVGDEVIFHGTRHYSNPNAVTGPSCKGGAATIVESCDPAKNRHPYYLVASDGESTVRGWVDADTFNKAK